MRTEHSVLLEAKAREVLVTLKADHGGVVLAGTVIEALLADRLGATGLGLGTKFREVEGRLPEHLVHRLRFVTAVRNDISHNPLAEIQKPEQFILAARQVIQALLEWQDAPAMARLGGRSVAVNAGRSERTRAFWEKPLAIGVTLTVLVFLFAGRHSESPKPASRTVPAQVKAVVVADPARPGPQTAAPSVGHTVVEVGAAGDAQTPPAVVATLPEPRKRVSPAHHEAPAHPTEATVQPEMETPGDGLNIDQIRGIKDRL